MKKYIKISLGVLGGIILLFGIDLICIFTINRPLLAVQSKCSGCYSGILYDTYKCADNSKIKIKLKGSDTECQKINFNKNIKSIVDNTETCDTALENGRISISDLDKFNIKYTKEKNNITLEDINKIIIDYISNDKNDKGNYVHNYIDTKKNKVIVGLVDNTVKNKKNLFQKYFLNVVVHCI